MDNDRPGRVSAKGNSNCQHQFPPSWNDDRTIYSFILNTNNNLPNEGVFQRMYISSFCKSEDCRETYVARTISLNFFRKKE
jgi:hypothetical protein